MVTNISLVTVYCLDQDTARDFYVNVLGFVTSGPGDLPAKGAGVQIRRTGPGLGGRRAADGVPAGRRTSGAVYSRG